MNHPEVFIYGLVDPRTPTKVRYVGASTNLVARHRDHCTLSGDRRNKGRVNWILQLRKAGIQPAIVVLEECSVENHGDREKYWIKIHQAGGGLFNVGRGGESARGIRAAVPQILKKRKTQ